MNTKPDTEKAQHKDPVCNMTVSSDSEFHSHHEDKDYYFCSKHCLHKFKERPEQYLDNQTSAPHETHGESTPYTCPMHPEIQQQGPGDCPKCGMALEPMSAPATSARTGDKKPEYSDLDKNDREKQA